MKKKNKIYIYQIKKGGGVMFEKYRDLAAYPDVLNLKDVANYCRISKDSARKACVDGKLKHIRIGRLYKITKENLINFLENNNE